jgi:hypothetical protein
MKALLGKSSTAVEAGDEESPLLHLHPPPQVTLPLSLSLLFSIIVSASYLSQ